eukprot:1446896-Pyramimonas_sp.AAC.1
MPLGVALRTRYQAVGKRSGMRTSDALTRRYDTLTRRYDTLTRRYDTLRRRYDTLTRRYDTLTRRGGAAYKGSMSVWSPSTRAVSSCGDCVLGVALSFGLLHRISQ